MIARSWKWILLACAPFAVVADFMEMGSVPVFVLSALAVIPLAAFIGESTGHLARHLGPSAGALINATFGNLAEMIIAVFAVRAGLLEVVKASLTGSILGNLLFDVGFSVLYMTGYDPWVILIRCSMLGKPLISHWTRILILMQAISTTIHLFPTTR